MGRLDDLKILYTSAPPDKKMRVFDSILPPCRILNLLTVQDIMELNSIAKSKKLSSEPIKKFDMIKTIMARRGFKKLSSGTNRIAFKYMEDQSIVIKVAYDSVGLSDNLHEMYNQYLIKPFCTKVFEVSPCGTVGMFERVRAVKNREEFQSIAYDVYDIIVNEFVGKYILADIGTKFFMNWGVRQDSHPVILDFPYIYELDGSKIYCNRPDLNSEYGFCGGDIDYDEGFNHLVCTKCGKTFLASELKLAAEKKSKDIIIEEEDLNMIVEVKKGDEVIQRVDSASESQTYRKDKNGRRKETPYEFRKRHRFSKFDVVIKKETVETDDKKEESITEKIGAPINPDQYNTGWGLKDVPDVDELYKDMSLTVYDRHGEKIAESVSEERARVETAIDMAQQATVFHEEENEVESEEEETVAYDNDQDEKDEYAEAKKVLEIIPGDNDQSEDNSNEDLSSF